VQMPGSFRIFRIAGIDINIHISWLIILVFLTFSLATGWFPITYPGSSTATYYLLGFIASILLFVSVLLHELAHSFVARSRGLQVKSIVLFIFGGVSNIEQEPQTPGIEFSMAFVGPLVSLLIGVVCYGLWLLVRGTHSLIVPILSYLALMNIILGIFNLIPGFPLDGGRVLRSIIWKATGNFQTATNITTFVGQAFAYLIILWGILLFFAGNAFNGLIIIFTGWFLLTSAQSARSQSALDTAFRGVTVNQIMDTNVLTVPANISLQKLVDEYFLPRGLRSAFVMQGDQLAGLITLSDIRHVPRDQWPQTPVGYAMIPLERLHTITPQQNVKDVLPLMTGQDVNQLAVVQDGRLVGVLTREGILRSLEIRRNLGVDRNRTAS
ncbi:MAG TPA: site-2 protease family protein, partial [Ktedonobacteraceae bacterium]|nr:site-2 protease family protein [Ktedonobacteraceae bacterium]